MLQLLYVEIEAQEGCGLAHGVGWSGRTGLEVGRLGVETFEGLSWGGTGGGDRCRKYLGCHLCLAGGGGHI